ncbi:MAG TPA: hypothetical protein VGL56_02400 [Fimbriimonadaceae bacterium]|jgi:hypothetical protein
MAELYKMTKGQAAIIYRQQAKEYEKLGGNKSSLNNLVPGFSKAYKATADYAYRVANDLEKNPGDVVEIEMNSTSPVDVVSFREKVLADCVTEPFLAGLSHSD